MGGFCLLTGTEPQFVKLFCLSCLTLFFGGLKRGFSWTRGGGGFGLGLQGTEGDLGGVEELSAALRGDGADQDAVGGAGDDIANAIVSFENRHGIAIGGSSFAGSDELAEGARIVLLYLFHVFVEGALPGGTATAQSRPGSCGTGWGTGLESG